MSLKVKVNVNLPVTFQVTLAAAVIPCTGVRTVFSVIEILYPNLTFLRFGNRFQGEPIVGFDLPQGCLFDAPILPIARRVFVSVRQGFVQVVGNPVHPVPDATS